MVPRQPGSEPHFLRKAKLPKQINQSVKISLGERLSQLAQPRSSKGNCSRSPRRKQQIVLRSSSPTALLPSPLPSFLGCREHLCHRGSARDSTASPSGPRAVPSLEPLLWGEGTEPLFGSCPGFAWRPSLAPCVSWPLALGGSHDWRWGWQANALLDRPPYLIWRLGSDGDQRG